MLRERLGKEVLVFDGAMGTQLQEAGLKAGELPEVLNITNPQLIEDVHKRYLEAGSDFITTNTFGCNRLKMKDCGYDYKELLKAAVDNAKRAKESVDREVYIALDIGPIGQLLKPMGTLSFDEAYDIIKEQVLTVKEDVDLVLFETMSDIYEVKAGVLAVKENTDLPVFVSMTYEKSGRTLSGCDPITMCTVLEGLGVDVLGVNCSLGPVELTPIIDSIIDNTNIPIMLEPNAGLPCLVEGKTCYQMSADTFVKETIKHVYHGISVVGGCCGTTPAFIKGLKDNIPSKVTHFKKILPTRVSSGVKTVSFGKEVVVCGERLNPTGKKKLKQALLDENYEIVMREAINQVEAGAHVLDVNVGVPKIDEVKTMHKVVEMLQEVITLPLQIDSSQKSAIEVACRYYNGKPLINSVNGKKETMDAIFPIVKKYGGTVIGLTLDENGIPAKAEERLAIARKIVSYAKECGIDKKDIIIDCLVLTASAQQKEVYETIKAVKMVKEELGVHTVLGVSNVSFGLPNRPLLNRTFLSMALSAGLDLPIINPNDSELMATIDAFNVLYNYDVDAVNYIEKQANQEIVKPVSKTLSLEDIILHGLKEEVEASCKELLKEKEGLAIINEILIPALDKVGKQYEKNQIFLPQLIQSAETSKIAFGIIKESFTTSSATKGPVLMATVEGDIHDIGKNIVKVVLESYGYQIIDLGKDVKIEAVVEAYHKYHPKAIGLSALMTTTVISMEKTIQALKEIENVCPIWVGGAVLTNEFAKQIGADFYTKDAMESVELLNKIIK